MAKMAKYDVIVVGGGHAGIEASLAAARMGCSTLLVTMDVSAIGRMSCNPAIGGTAKGQLVREIDALGGEMGKLADATGIHFRMLNTSKGPAVWSPRCQNDRDWYSAEAQKSIKNQEGIEILEDGISDLECERGSTFRISSITTRSGERIECTTAVICAGTFLRALMHTGTVITSYSIHYTKLYEFHYKFIRNLDFSRLCLKLEFSILTPSDREDSQERIVIDNPFFI